MKSPHEGSQNSPDSVPQEEILSLLSGMTQEVAGLHTTAVKYTTLKRILSDVATRLPAHTRLPGIRDIAKPLGLSPVTAQRAVAELTEEGVLYSRPRSGVFVAEHGVKGIASSSASASAAAVPPSFPHGTQHPFRATFRFGTDSAAPYQRKFWEETCSQFSAQHPNIAPLLQFEAGASLLRDETPDSALGQPDVREGYDRNEPLQKETDGVLDIAAFSWDPFPVKPIRGRLLPLYHRTYFLFSNRSLLDRHGLPHPEYRTFAGQTDYLRDLAPRLEALGLSPKPYSIQEPVTLFGGRIGDFSALLAREGEDAPLRERLTATIDQLVSFCRCLRYSIAQRDGWLQARNDFLKGKEPFFLGYSVDYWEFAQKKLPFHLGAYPSLCCDDSLFLWPRVGSIAGRSEHPVEGMAFLHFLLRPETQKRFAATGNFGANLAPDYHPAMAADHEWIAAALEKSAPFRFATREDYYMAVNVLGGALWRNLVDQLSAQETVEQALQLGRSYLLHRSARSPDKGGG